MQDVMKFLQEALNSVAPGMAGIALVSAPIVKYIVDFIKSYVLKNIQGNVVQTVVLVVSVMVVLAEAAVAGVFGDGLALKEIYGLLLILGIVFTGAIGFDQITENTNDPKLHRKD